MIRIVKNDSVDEIHSSQSRAQTLMYQRTIDDWEMQRYQLEMEYLDLLSRIENLSEEVILSSAFLDYFY